jgi:tagatose-1,6-bisphosphate aldolase non-catalytic subunit AgaZ/GatZ
VCRNVESLIGEPVPSISSARGPGSRGAQRALGTLAVTTPEAAIRTVEAHRQAFEARGLEEAFSRAVGVAVHWVGSMPRNQQLMKVAPKLSPEPVGSTSSTSKPECIRCVTKLT